jgi:excisionase family DNA binding protein
LLHDRKTAAYVLSISVRTLDYEIAAGEIKTRRIGGKVLITARELKRFAADHPQPIARRAA